MTGACSLTSQNSENGMFLRLTWMMPSPLAERKDFYLNKFMKISKLAGQDLANAYAATFKYLGKVWAHYDGGGWISLCGNSLEPHPSLKHLYPNGWTLGQRVRVSEARKRVIQACDVKPRLKAATPI
jgi:hypothetical protein